MCISGKEGKKYSFLLRLYNKLYIAQILFIE